MQYYRPNILVPTRILALLLTVAAMWSVE